MSQAEHKHVVAIIGAAVAGSEAARVLSEAGATVVVFERNPRPYGKIEDGLPIWHGEQRKAEYQRINERLTLPGVHYVPNTGLGRDITLAELIDDWGVSAVLLATGAWRDRLPSIPGIEQYVGHGLVLQNSLVYWFNHHREQSYSGPRYQIPDNTVVFGGGLASIDVVKILMLETVAAALETRGIIVDILELERKGIPFILAQHGLSLDALGLKGCILFYRRRKIDMPLAELPADVTPERRAKVEQVRAKILDNAQRKYLFRYQECTLPMQPIAEGSRLTRMQCVRTKVEAGRVTTLPNSTFEVRAPLFVSSLGSIPEPLPPIEQVGDYYRFVDEQSGKLAQYENVFGLGNVVTGKGNIRVSRKHSQMVARALIEEELAELGAYLAERPPLHETKAAEILDRVHQRQTTVGYDNYEDWIAHVTPPDMQ